MVHLLRGKLFIDESSVGLTASPKFSIQRLLNIALPWVPPSICSFYMGTPEKLFRIARHRFRLISGDGAGS